MRHPVIDDDDKETVKELNADQWMIDALNYNPDYVSWGPHEDYMWKREQSWESAVFVNSWKEFDWDLDELNEVVNFYFCIDRKNEKCTCCDACGYNPETRKIADDFYDFNRTGRRWCDAITQDEVEALQSHARLRVYGENGWEKKEGLTAEEVNETNKNGGMLHSFNHDAINRWILIETRAKRLGVWGRCSVCSGSGYVFLEPKAKLQLILWVIHPRKGCSRGVEIADIRKSDLPAVFAYLREAAERNANRFGKIPSA